MKPILKSNLFITFSKEQWRCFRQDTPLTLSEEDIAQLQGVNEAMSMTEVIDIYLPLSRLLNLYVSASQNLYQVMGRFLNQKISKVPYIIGIAGSVAVGKSTTSRVLQALLSRWPNHSNVALVTTDGFLYPLAQLQKWNLLDRKGFPESYDLPKLLRFLQDIKSGKSRVQAPVYSHHTYDIVPGETIDIEQPDIVIVEGLNVLQTGAAVLRTQSKPNLFVSDFFDFSIYVDANVQSIKKWFIDRVLLFRDTAFRKSDSYFHYICKMTPEETVKFAERVWREINELNLIENIFPYRERASLILRKCVDHSVEQVWLRKW